MADAPNLTELTASNVAPERDLEVVDLDEATNTDALAALSSETARELFAALRESPAYPTALAESTETSVQNVHYHLEKLEAAGLVEVVDTVSSAKGRAMKVYAPAANPFVFVSGIEDTDAIEETLAKLLGALGVVSFASVTVQKLIEVVFHPGGPQAVNSSGAYAMAPMTNVAPPVGLFVFLAGILSIISWALFRRGVSTRLRG